MCFLKFDSEESEKKLGQDRTPQSSAPARAQITNLNAAA
jgi:hypothetical protein